MTTAGSTLGSTPGAAPAGAAPAGAAPAGAAPADGLVRVVPHAHSVPTVRQLVTGTLLARGVTVDGATEWVWAQAGADRSCAV